MEPRGLILILLITALLLSAPVTSPALANTMDMMHPGQPGHHHGPPLEFIEACQDKEAGDTVTLETPRGDQVKAVCEQKGDQLIARPINPPSQPPDQAPEK